MRLPTIQGRTATQPSEPAGAAERSAAGRPPPAADEDLRARIRHEAARASDFAFLPTQLAIETVAVCNAACIMCPYPTLQRQKGRMTPEAHRIICAKVRAWGAPIRSISHAGMGEPLADRRLEERIRHEKRVFPEAEVTVYTNASLLDPPRVATLLDAGLDRLSISLNAARPETYEAVMNLPYERTRKNVEHLLAEIERRGGGLAVQVSLIPTARHTPEEVAEFTDYWRPRVAAVVVPPWIAWGGFFAPPDLPPGQRWPCRYIWDVLMIDWDGTVKMCCEDYESRYRMGNLLTDDPDEMFNSELLRRQRQAQLRGDFHTPEICRNCVETGRSARDWWQRATLHPASGARQP